MVGILFAFLINAGNLKTIYGSLFPVDLTVLILISLVLILLFEIITNRRFLQKLSISNQAVILIFFLFIFTIIFSSFYTLSDSFYIEKMGRVIFLNIPSFLVPIFFFTKKDLKIFIVVSAILFIVGSIEIYYLFKIHGPALFISFEKIGLSDYLSWASFFGRNLLIPVGMVIAIRKKNQDRMYMYLILILIIFTSYSMFIMGARGPFLFFLFTISLMIVLKGKKDIIVRYTLIFLIFLSLFVATNQSTDKYIIGSANRVLSMSLQANSVNERLRLYKVTMEAIKEKPILGYGIGSFGTLMGEGDSRNYPHNLFLELWVECGVLSIVFLLIFVILILMLSLKKISNPYVFAMFWPCLFLFLNLMKSGSITDARTFFGILGVLFSTLNFSNSLSDKFWGHFRVSSNINLWQRYLSPVLKCNGLVKNV